MLKVFVLLVFNQKKRIILETNILDYIVEDYLSQEDKEKQLCLIIYYLQKLIFIKINYNIYI